MKKGLLHAGVLALAALASAPPASAAEFFGGPYEGGFSLSLGGFIRQETAGRIDAPANPWNQNGDPFDDRTIQRQAYLPPTFTNIQSVAGILGNPNLNIGPATTWSSVPLPNLPVVCNNCNIPVNRGDFVPSKSNDFNYVILRSDIEMGLRFGEGFSITARLRGVYQPDIYNDFNAASVDRFQGGIGNGYPQIYRGKPDFFDYVVDGDNHPDPLEWTGRNYQIYFPALIAEYHAGRMDLRIGNQQIAWGQAIFLRVFDVPDGLDYRRHILLDRGLEEFSDIRVPAPAIRLQYQLTDSILLDAYVQKFQPSVLPNSGTPYFLIPPQFTIQDKYYEGGYSRWTTLSGGFRLKADYGNWGWELGFARRYNPDGTFGWTETGLVRPLQGGPGSLGALVNTAYDIKASGCGAAYTPVACRLYPNSAVALSHAPFDPEPGGVYTAPEWFYYAAATRVPAIGALNAAINNFPATRDIYASPVTNYQDAVNELNTFFAAAGGSLRGDISRKYYQEDNYMLGLNYVVSSSSNFLDQMILNFEFQYTPHASFLINLDASPIPTRENNYKAVLTVDKWYRFFEGLPSTYVILEGYTEQRADLVGRLLRGYGGTPTSSANGISGNANYVVLGALQPFHNKIFAFEFASLFDPRGGILLQPGLQWNPGHNISVEGYFNYINGDLYGNPNENLLSTLDFAKEAFIRLTYQFQLQ